jgi:hypothetical protein
MQTLPHENRFAPRTSAEIAAAAKTLSAEGHSDHAVAAILAIDVCFARQLIGLSRLLANRFGR